MFNETELVRYTFILFIAETGLGSFLHGLKVPLTGHFLSLNQSFWLTRLCLKDMNALSPYYASQVVSLLKTLSPAGKKLTPMLGISMQGLFFHAPLRIFGVNRISLIMGGVSLSLWAFLQPLLLYLIIFGKKLFDVADYYLSKLNEVINFIPEKLTLVLTIVILIKIFLSIIVSFFAFNISSNKEKDLENKLLGLKSNDSKTDTKMTLLNGLMKDLTRPLFLVTLILTAIFFYYQEHDLAKTVWQILRPLTIAIVIFSILRIYPIDKLERLLKKDSNTQKLFIAMIKKIRGQS